MKDKALVLDFKAKCVNVGYANVCVAQNKLCWYI